ncbi:MAG: hypothetical protein ACW99A_19680 [Candidatus Kariarchaeaceae archaeon]|jgi:hypothetical protein
MKKETIILLLLIFSVGLLVPIAVQDQNVTVLTNRETDFLYNNHNPTIKFESDIEASVSIQLFKIDPVRDAEKPIENVSFTKTTEIDNLDPGFYRIRFLSDRIVNITIQGSGIYQISIILFVVLLLSNIVLYYRKYMD